MNVKEVNAYFAECPYCGKSKISRFKKDIDKWIIHHQGKGGKECPFNPVNKLCGSCKHHIWAEGRCDARHNYFKFVFTQGTCKYWECRDELKQYITNINNITRKNNNDD